MMEKKKKHTALKVILIILAVLLVIAGGLAFYAHSLLTRPESYFDRSETIYVKNPGRVTAISPHESIPDIIVPQIRDEKPLEETGEEHEVKDNIINVLLMGIDAFESGRSTSGTMPHADAIMVIAINFDKEKVDLISLPRDTFTTAPGHNGYYKLNGVFNVGGGMKDPKAGFELVSRAAEKWLGGISIPYYYGVDFQAVIDIVNAIGGVDYNLDYNITTFSGKKYSPGKRHLDGEAVMAYLRIRKSAEGTDRSRTNRQRRMMVAIFNQIKKKNLFSVLPSLINAANSGIWTNTTLSQTAALAGYAMRYDTDSIGLHVMDGRIQLKYEWAWSFVDQQPRIDLIDEVYGIKTGPVGICTTLYEKWLHEHGFLAIKYIRQAEKVINAANSLADKGELSKEQTDAYRNCFNAYSALIDAFENASSFRQEHYEGSLGSEEQERFNSLNAELSKKEAPLKEAVLELEGSIGLNEALSWSVRKDWYNDRDINDTYVDFR